MVRWRSRIDREVAAGRTVWCIFDNTAEGAAVPDALELMGRKVGPSDDRSGVESAGPNATAPSK
jgi:uncharacterized protein YecE (DUF72 family)